MDLFEKYLGEANYMADIYPTNTELQEIIRKKLEEQGYVWDGERGYDDWWRDYSKEVTDNRGNKYYFHIPVLVSLVKNNPGEIGYDDITLGLDVYRDKSLLRRIFSKNKTQKIKDISSGYKTAKTKDISQGVDFEQPNEIRKAVLQRTPSAVRKLESTALDRISRMPDPSTLKENKTMNEKSRWAKLAGLPKPTEKKQLDENIGGVVSIGAINQIFDRKKSDYEMAFEHFMGERYDTNESKEGDVKEKWINGELTDDQKINLLLGVWDDPDMAEKYFDMKWENLPDAAKVNMRMDMLEEGNGAYAYEREIVHSVIDGIKSDFYEEDMTTREYINTIISALEELKITDF